MLNHHFHDALWLIFPLVLAGALHMWVVSRGLFSFLALPLHTPLFGRNKTYRGFVVMPVFCVLGLWAAHALQLVFYGVSLYDSANIFGLGVMLGIAYCLGELPNSFLKRRLGIAPGKTVKRYFFLTVVTDHVDSVLPCLGVYALIVHVGWQPLVVSGIAAPAVHLLLNWFLFLLKLRKEPL